MQENVTLERLNGNDEAKILEIINSDANLKDTFSGERNTIYRILNSSYSALIKDNDETVGFIMMVNNDKTSSQEIDMGVLSQHRNKGYGTKALGLLKEKIIEQQVKVNIQIEKMNIAAIRTVVKNGFILSREDEKYSYYTIGEENEEKKRI